MENKHCRFCAKLESDDSLVNLDYDEDMRYEVALKLAFVNAVYVNISDENIPRTVCFQCLDCLNKAYEFLSIVRNAQETLESLYLNPTEIEYLDDDFFTVEHGEIKIENETLAVKKELNADDILEESLDVNIKLELEPEENIDENCLNRKQNNKKAETTKKTRLPKRTSKREKNPNKKFESLTSKITPPNKNLKSQETSESEDEDIKKTNSWLKYPWLCKYCGKQYPDVETLRSHSKSTHKRCTPFSCVDCNEYKKLKGRHFTYYIRHVQRHRPLLWNKCHYCDTNLEKQKLAQHLQEHYENINLTCLRCGEIFKNKQQLEEHDELYKIKPKRTEPVLLEDRTCKICKQVCKSLHILRGHMKIHATDRKKAYTCDRCGKSYHKKCGLAFHIQTHEKTRRFACKICSLSFQYPHMLKLHVQVHTGEKPYSCELCGNKFRLMGQLRQHKRVHSDDLPFKCNVCSKAFRYKIRLVEHERQHTGCKPFRCEECSQAFSNWSNLNKHMKLRHKIEISKNRRNKVTKIESEEIEEWKNQVLAL